MSERPLMPRSARRSFVRAVLCAAVAAPALLLPAVFGRTATAADAAPAAGAEDETGFRPLFNGKDLTGWDGEPGVWSVVDGVIVGEPKPDKPLKINSFLVWRDGVVDDFEFRCSFKVDHGNSGVQYRSVEFGKWHVKGYQADMENGLKYTGMLYEEKVRGILCPRGDKVTVLPDGKRLFEHVTDSAELQKDVIKNADWNDYVIIARGNHIVQKVNGHVTAEVIDNDKKNFRRSGILALQVHAHMIPMKVEFKNLRLKRLKLEDAKKIVMVAGHPSHGPGAHEFNAGVTLLKKRLDAVPGLVVADYHNGWPRDPTAFDNADAVVLYMDGGANHPLIQHLDQIGQLTKRGVGLMCMHYSVEIPKGEGGDRLKDWIGGYYEQGYSINPIWMANLKLDEKHPIARGVKPFDLVDEWYFNIRFRDGMRGVQSILTAKPGDKVRDNAAKNRLGPHKEVVENKGRSETLLWAVERPDGGRGVGYTGGHFHKNWANDNLRKLILNAIVWVAGAEVPPSGIDSEPVSAKELEANLDKKPVPKPAAQHPAKRAKGAA